MVSGAVKDKNGFCAPVRILSVKLTSQPLEVCAKDPTIVTPLTHREPSFAMVISANYDCQTLAQWLWLLSQALTGHAPAASDKCRMVQICLVNVDYSLAGQHLINQLNRKFLALVKAAIAIGARCE